jgi:hypothetical protein
MLPRKTACSGAAGGIRRKLGLTQEAAGEIIGGTSRVISSALVLLDHDAKSIELLEARRMNQRTGAYNDAQHP